MADLVAELVQHRFDVGPPQLAARTLEIGELHNLDHGVLVAWIPLHLGVVEDLSPHGPRVAGKRPRIADHQVLAVGGHRHRHLHPAVPSRYLRD